MSADYGHDSQIQETVTVTLYRAWLDPVTSECHCIDFYSPHQWGWHSFDCDNGNSRPGDVIVYLHHPKVQVLADRHHAGHLVIRCEDAQAVRDAIARGLRAAMSELRLHRVPGEYLAM